MVQKKTKENDDVNNSQLLISFEINNLSTFFVAFFRQGETINV